MDSHSQSASSCFISPHFAAGAVGVGRGAASFLATESTGTVLIPRLMTRIAGHEHAQVRAPFTVGQPVLARDYRPTSKSKWQPATVTEILGPLTYRVQLTNEDAALTWKRHLDQLLARTPSAAVAPPRSDPEPKVDGRSRTRRRTVSSNCVAADACTLCRDRLATTTLYTWPRDGRQITSSPALKQSIPKHPIVWTCDDRIPCHDQVVFHVCLFSLS